MVGPPADTYSIRGAYPQPSVCPAPEPEPDIPTHPQHPPLAGKRQAFTPAVQWSSGLPLLLAESYSALGCPRKTCSQDKIEGVTQGKPALRGGSAQPLCAHRCSTKGWWALTSLYGEADVAYLLLSCPIAEIPTRKLARSLSCHLEFLSQECSHSLVCRVKLDFSHLGCPQGSPGLLL